MFLRLIFHCQVCQVDWQNGPCRLHRSSPTNHWNCAPGHKVLAGRSASVVPWNHSWFAACKALGLDAEHLLVHCITGTIYCKLKLLKIHPWYRDPLLWHRSLLKCNFESERSL
jgi:hypothetical protein